MSNHQINRIDATDQLSGDPAKRVGRTLSAVLLACLLATSLACRNEDKASEADDTSVIALPVISGSKLNHYLRSSEAPVLVEFGVDYNCPRCAQTKKDVVALREALKGDVDVVRVDFNANAQMVAQLGGTVCPTYVLFSKAEPMLTRSYPITIDLLHGEILRELGK
jgi:thioredoxin-related protein